MKENLLGKEIGGLIRACLPFVRGNLGQQEIVRRPEECASLYSYEVAEMDRPIQFTVIRKSASKKTGYLREVTYLYA
ncbi:MAG: hypothetical protein ACKO6Q_04410 [Bacteroidota bacterium]